MSIIDRLSLAARTLFGPRNSITESADLYEALALALGGGPTDSGESVTPGRAMGLTTVYACVSLTARSQAHLPLVPYVIDGTSRKPDVGNPLYSLLKDQPNEWQTSFEWRELKQRDLELRGNAYSMIVWGFGGRVSELIRLHPDAVRVEQDQSTLALTYHYTRKDGRVIKFTQKDILHIRGFGDDGVVGHSPITVHRETIGEGIALRRHSARFFSNGAKPLGVIEIAGDMGEEARAEFRKDWQSTYAGGDNSHKTFLMPVGMSYKPIQISMRDAEYIKQRQFSRSEIASMYGVPPHMVGDLQESTNNNIEHQGIEFVVHCMTPRCVRWEQAIKRDLLNGDPKRYVKFNLDALLRGTAKERAEALQIKRQNGVINADEWRELDDMNPRTDKGGKEYIVQANMRIQDGTKPEPGGQNTPPAQ